jgi:hypothetical protein
MTPKVIVKSQFEDDPGLCFHSRVWRLGLHQKLYVRAPLGELHPGFSDACNVMRCVLTLAPLSRRNFGAVKFVSSLGFQVGMEPSKNFNELAGDSGCMIVHITSAKDCGLDFALYDTAVAE